VSNGLPLIIWSHGSSPLCDHVDSPTLDCLFLQKLDANSVDRLYTSVYTYDIVTQEVRYVCYMIYANVVLGNIFTRNP